MRFILAVSLGKHNFCLEDEACYIREFYRNLNVSEQSEELLWIVKIHDYKINSLCLNAL